MSKKGRIPYETKMAIRQYARAHTLVQTATKFSVAHSTVHLYVENVISQPVLLQSKEAKEPRVCKKFGCGRRLTREEMLYGDWCLDHSKIFIE